MHRSAFHTPAGRIAAGAAAAAWLLATALAATAGGPSPESCKAREFQPDDPTLTRAGWLAPGRLRIQAGTVAGLEVGVRARVNFGPFHHEWIAATLPMAPGEVRLLDLEIPPQAFLHPLASTYVADLLVRVEPRDGKGRPRQETALDNLFVAWPQGPGGPPRLWDEETLPRHGVLDPRLQQMAARVGPDARLGPPIAHLVEGRRAVEEDTRGEDTPYEGQLPAATDDEETTP